MVWLVVFPATSAHTAVAGTLTPSGPEYSDMVQGIQPERLSDPVTVKVTGLLYQILKSGVRLAVMLMMDGAVVSSLTLRGMALVVLPTASVQDPLKSVPVVSAV